MKKRIGAVSGKMIDKMNPIKHTPGPWEIGAGDENSFGIFGLDGNVRPCLASVWQGHYEGDRREIEAEINARLIVAAPELLAALKSLVDPTSDRIKAYEDARAAIAKAEGR